MNTILPCLVALFASGNPTGAHRCAQALLYTLQRLTDHYVNRGLLRNELLGDRAGGIADMQQAARLYQQQDNTKDYQMIHDLIEDW